MSADKLEQRVSELKRYYVILIEMVRRHDERLDEHAAMFRETDEKIAALAAAQIKTEDALRQLTARMMRKASSPCRARPAKVPESFQPPSGRSRDAPASGCRLNR